MIELSGSIKVENPAEILRNQNGIFRVTSPEGQVFQVTCRKGSLMRIREIGGTEKASVSEPRQWQIEKLVSPIV